MLGLLEDLAEVQRKIDDFPEKSKKRKSHISQGQSLLLKVIFLLIILLIGFVLKVSAALLLLIVGALVIYFVLSSVYLKKGKEKGLLGQVFSKRESSNLKKLEDLQKKLQTDLNQFHRLSFQVSSIDRLSHLIRYMKRGEAQTLEEALYFLEMDEKMSE